MKALLIASLLLLSTPVSVVASDCSFCRDDLNKALDACKSEPSVAAQEVCRENASREAKTCAKKGSGGCSLDLLMEAQENKKEAAQQDEYVHAGIARLYKEFNAALRQAGPGDSEALSPFFTKANRAANQCAFFALGCRSSSRAFNQVITLTEYEIVSIETNVNRSVDLMVLGKSLGDGDNAEGVKVGLVVNWLFEEEKWRIDSIMKGPPDRESVRRKFSIRKQWPQPVAPKD